MLLASGNDERVPFLHEIKHGEDGVRILHLEDLLHHGRKPADLLTQLHVRCDDLVAVQGLVGEPVEDLVEKRYLSLILQRLEKTLHQRDGCSLGNEVARHLEIRERYVLMSEAACVRVNAGQGDCGLLRGQMDAAAHCLQSKKGRIGANASLMDNRAGDVRGIRGVMVEDIDLSRAEDRSLPGIP